MKTLFSPLLSLLGAAACSVAGMVPAARADVISPVQSTADPYGLPVIAPVEVAGSDAAAAAFMSQLPSIKALLTANLPEYKNNSTFAAANKVTLDDFQLAATSAVRVYFVSEGGSYHSSLGLNVFTDAAALPTASTARLTSTAQWIFPDASSNDPTQFFPAGNSVRTATAPLLAGDFVDLGTFGAGTLLDFVLASNSVNGGTSVLTAETARNPDNFQHIVAFQVGNYMVLSIEDATNGGDKDYNDVVMAVELTPVAMTPEPGTWGALVFLCGAIGVNAWRNRRHKMAQSLA